MAYTTYADMDNKLVNKEIFEGNSVTAVMRGKYYVVYSYATVIAVITPSDKVVINVTKYSPTTSKMQNKLRRLFENARLMTVNKKNAFRDSYEVMQYAENFLK